MATFKVRRRVIGYKAATFPGADDLEIFEKDDLSRYTEYADVPKAMCDYLADRLGAGILFKAGFRLLSHLLAHTSERGKTSHYIPQEIRCMIAKGDKTNTDSETAAKRFSQLITAGVVEMVSEGGWLDRTYDNRRQANVYRIPNHLYLRWRESIDHRWYSSPSGYLNRRPSGASPKRDLHYSFDGEHLDPALLRAINRLQDRALHCDLSALKLHVRELGPVQWDRWKGILTALHDGPNYASYRLATSGRIQSYNANLQGVPRKLRRFFYPCDEDHCFLDLDFKSQEPWIVAHLSGDTKLMAVLAGGDLYQLVADEFDLDRNEQAKPMVNAYNYGARTKALALAAAGLDDGRPPGWAIKLARRFQRFMKKRFPVSAAWVDRQVEKIQAAGHAVAPEGLVRREILAGEAATKGVNHIVQGTGAAILHQILITLDAALDDLGWVALPMHDGLVLQVRRDRRAEAQAIATKIMQGASMMVLGIPIPVEASLGWKDKSERAEDVNKRPG